MDYDFKYLSRIIDEVNPIHRIDSILKYVKEHNIEKYIVLDDEIDVEKVQNLISSESDRIPFTKVQIRYTEGLTNQNVMTAIEYLNK